MAIYEKGPRFVIDMMPEIADALNRIVDWVESRPKNQRILAGPNILLREDDDTVILEGTAAGEPAIGPAPCPFDVILTAQEPPEEIPEDYVPTYDVTTHAGTVNQLLTSNYNEEGGFAEIKGDAVGYLILHIDFDEDAKVTSSSLKVEEETCPELPIEPDMPPPAIDLLVGVIDKGSFSRTLSCGSLVTYPFLHMQQEGVGYWSYKVETW